MTCQIILHESGVLELSGELAAQTLVPIIAAGKRCIDQCAAQKITLHLGQVTESDSSGIALLLEWMRFAKTKDKQLVLTAVPAKMLDIARVSGVEQFLTA